MGLISFCFDLLTLSAGAAAVRRLTGYSAKEFVMARVPEKRLMLRTAASSFFNVGEAVVFSIVKYSEVVRVTREAKQKEAQNKIDSTKKD